MKNRILFILLMILCIPAAASLVSAESGLYPIGQYPQPSYPVPQYNQPGQQNPYYPNYNSPYYYNPYYMEPTPTPIPQPVQPYFYQQPYVEQPYYYQQPMQPQQPQQPPYYNDPNCGNNSWIVLQEPQQPNNPGTVNKTNPVITPTGPRWQEQPKPGYQDPNVYVNEEWNQDGTIRLSWTIRNTTPEDWAKSNVDIKCISGCHLLTRPEKTLWDIPYTVRRNESLSFSVMIRQTYQGDAMTFAMVAGSKTLYTFNVRI